MSDTVNTYSGRQIFISTTAEATALLQAGFEGLSFTEVGFVGKIGAYGNDTNILNYPLLNEVVSQKQKGMTNAGDPEVECARNDADAGQTAMKAAGAPDYYSPHAFKVINQDGSVDYLRGLVTGPVSPGGGNEDFDLHQYTLALIQSVVHVDASV